MSMDHDDDSWNMAVGAEPEEEGRRDEDEDGSRKRSEGEGRRERGEEEGEGEGEARTSMLDLDLDSLVQLCSSQLHVTDLANMAMSCKRMRDAVSVDPIWEQQCRKRWPSKQVPWGTFQYCGDRNAYRERHIASLKFEFLDPAEWHIATSRARVNHILIEGDYILVAQGPSINTYDVSLQSAKYNLSGHSAQITCMRLVPATGFAPQGKSDGVDNLLITSSMDHTIRLWHNGNAVRTFRGHVGPVTTLSDSLLGVRDGSPTLASGGIDGTIRLWALVSGQKRGQTLKKTLHAHGLAIKQLVVPEYNPSLLVSAAKDLKMRVWNSTTGGLIRSIKIPGVPVALVCKGSTCYVAGSSGFMLSDFRSMSAVSSVLAHESGILSFGISNCGEIICTGGGEKIAKLWDIRSLREPYAVLGKHMGDVDFVYVDKYKAVTGGSRDSEVYVWDAVIGDRLNTFGDALSIDYGLTTLTVKGTAIATATSDGLIHYRDFSNCALSTVKDAIVEVSGGDSSRFWVTNFDVH